MTRGADTADSAPQLQPPHAMTVAPAVGVPITLSYLYFELNIKTVLIIVYAWHQTLAKEIGQSWNGTRMYPVHSGRYMGYELDT